MKKMLIHKLGAMLLVVAGMIAWTPLSAHAQIRISDTAGPHQFPAQEGDCFAVVNFGPCPEGQGCANDFSFSTSCPDGIVNFDHFQCNPPFGSVFPVGITMVTCTNITDNCGNKADYSFELEVVDTQFPTLQVSDNARDNDLNDCGAVVNFVDIGITDNCPNPTFTCNPPSGSHFPIGTTLISCSGHDASGNTVSGTFDVIVTDKQHPIITINGDPSLAANGEILAVASENCLGSFTATVSDNCGVTDPIVCTNVATGATIDPNAVPLGTTRVGCFVKDVNGVGSVANTSNDPVSFLITVVPTVGDVIWHRPTAQDPAHSSTTGGPGRTARLAGVYLFKAGQTIPLKIHVTGCGSTADVTDQVEAFVTVDRIDQFGTTTIVGDFSPDDPGVGGPGGQMDHIDHHLMFNLKTDTINYPPGTVNDGTAWFQLTITIKQNDPFYGLVTVYSEIMILESKK